jgi:phosphate transport system substrate-binding protein
VPGALGENGDGAMVTGCAANPGCVSYTSIGSLDEADQHGLGQAKLGNASGKYLLPTANNVVAAASGFASKTPANQAISLINGPAADGYPIVNYEYAIVNSSQKDAATAQTLQAFLHWAITDGNNASFLDKLHFQPLPEPVVTLSDTQIAKISG